MTQLKGLVPKGWGSEFIWATNDRYCAKFLDFKTGGKCSMHFHRDKDETWYVQSGKFIVQWIDPVTAKLYEKEIRDGAVWHNMPCMPHQLTCVEAGTIIEVSTADSVEDNYRVFPGDSQK
jgi:mannose-6-phosphate isomerase-like protein (cupin superfamily)